MTLFQPKNMCLLLVCISLLALSLGFGLKASIKVVSGEYDSLRYLSMADTISMGEWQGEYDQTTLIRLPMYPLFMALNALAGWPLHIVQHFIYLLSVFLLAASLITINVTRWRIALVCALCGFHPIAFYSATFVFTEALYTPAATSMLAGCLGILGSARRSLALYGFWLAVLSVSTVVLWYTRSEGIWVLPFGGICLGIYLWECRSNFRYYRLRIPGVLLILFALIFLAGNSLESQNEKYYGIPVTYELAEPNFVAAMDLLNRVDPETHRPYVTMTFEALESIYESCPHVALLKPYLSKQTDGRGWSKYGCQWMDICDELVCGWAMWAVRDAVASIGMHDNAVHASEFYGTLAHEIQRACENGDLVCSRNPTGNILVKAPKMADLPRIFFSFIKISALAFTFGDVVEQLEKWRPSQLSPEDTEMYKRVTHDIDPQGGSFPRFVRIHFLIYMVLQITGGLIVFIVFAFCLFGRRMRTRINRLCLSKQEWIVMICAISFVISRIAIVSYLDAMCFWAQIRYLFVIYPALMLLICLALPSFGRTKGRGKGYLQC